MARKLYDGPTCFVGHDQDAADGRPLQGGWHYTVVEGPGGFDMPGEQLVVTDHGRYRLAVDSDKSHYERHHQRLQIVAPEGVVGRPQTDEEWEATHRHLNDLEHRLEHGEGLHVHERDHVLRSPADVRVMRGWLKDEQEREQR